MVTNSGQVTAGLGSALVQDNRPAGQNRADVSFSEELRDTIESGSNGTSNSGWSTGFVNPQWNRGAARQDLVAGTEETSSPQKTPDALGLRASVGSVATVDGITYYGSEEGWSLTVPTAQTPAEVVSGQELLGFEPEWVGEVRAVITDEDAQPIGTVELNRRLYATQETAEKLAAKLGATAVATSSTGMDSESTVPQWELEFGNGVRLNAGLVADMFLRDATRAYDRLRAEIDA